MGLYKSENRQIQQIRESEIIIRAVEAVRKDQPRIGVRKLQVMLRDDLNQKGIKIGRDGLFDLLREFDLLVKTKRYRHYTTDSKHRFKKYPNQIKDLTPRAPNHVWVSDITYIEGSKGFNYLSLITDAYSRKIVGHCLSDNYSAQGTIKALKKALKENKATKGLIHHSDRGVQYCCKEYTSILKRKNAVISMTENGSPYENAMAERINGILKTELLQNKYENKEQAIKAIDKAIAVYNNKRPHMSIGMLTPQQAHFQKGTLKVVWRKRQAKGIPLKEEAPCSFKGADASSFNYNLTNQ